MKKGTNSLLALWKAGYAPYAIGTYTRLYAPKLSLVSTTQSKVTVQVQNWYGEYRNVVDDTELSDKTTTISNLSPEQSGSVYLYVYNSDKSLYYSTSCSYTTKSISPSVSVASTASSVHTSGKYIDGDAVVTSQTVSLYKGSKVNSGILVATGTGQNCVISGLDPNTSYIAEYSIVANGKTYTTTSKAIQTQELSLTTSQPKVVSLGNVIVAAESNLDDEETNVGFEWRRTDWTGDFASNTGGAYLYGGVMEGYIRNLNTEKLWKYRPYYLSNSGRYYYGDWVGLDPTNTSYFDPTVHTYASISIDGNTALVKGYAMTGSDKITVQGFKYWKTVAETKDREGVNRLSSVPSDAMTVEADGQVMTASLTGLDYNSTYHYLAFVTTSEGETYYGEELVFETGDDPTGIGGIEAEPSEQKPVTVVARYNMNGQPISSPQKGINILRMSDGTVRKVLVK